MSRRTSKPIQPHWLSKIFAGLILGFLFAVGCSKLFMMLAGDTAPNATVQLAMWIVMPIWLTVFGFVFVFRRGIHAWMTLGSLNILIFTIAQLI